MAHRMQLIQRSIVHWCRVKVVQWNEDLYEKQLIERTTDACGGPVDVVLNFGTTSRSLHRSLQCLAPVSNFRIHRISK